MWGWAELYVQGCLDEEILSFNSEQVHELFCYVLEIACLFFPNIRGIFLADVHSATLLTGFNCFSSYGLLFWLAFFPYFRCFGLHFDLSFSLRLFSCWFGLFYFLGLDRLRLTLSSLNRGLSLSSHRSFPFSRLLTLDHSLQSLHIRNNLPSRFLLERHLIQEILIDILMDNKFALHNFLKSRIMLILFGKVVELILVRVFAVVDI